MNVSSVGDAFTSLVGDTFLSVERRTVRLMDETFELFDFAAAAKFGAQEVASFASHADVTGNGVRPAVALALRDRFGREMVVLLPTDLATELVNDLPSLIVEAETMPPPA